MGLPTSLMPLSGLHVILPEAPGPALTARRIQAALWLGAGLAGLWLLAQLSPILAPFLLAGILAYITNPLVDRLQAAGLPRVLGVVGVLALLGALVAGLLLVLLPLLIDEARILRARMPQAVALFNEQVAPWVQQHFGLRLRLDPATLKRLVMDNKDSLQSVAQQLLESLRIGGVALVGLAVNLILAPVVMFYLLLDWHPLAERIDRAVPRAWHATVRRLAGDVDAVLSQFLRGQLAVMLALAAYYGAALSIAGLPSAIAVGLVTGLLIFIPYVGFSIGFALALTVAGLQFAGWAPVIAVLVVYGIGQVIEGFLLTPYLVGERIGLHPLAVIFALMAFGQLFGFFGVLLALPASAALLVGLRELHALYLDSHFYRGDA